MLRTKSVSDQVYIPCVISNYITMAAQPTMSLRTGLDFIKVKMQKKKVLEIAF